VTDAPDPSRGFKDHFSDRPGEYAEARPTYPAPLFDWLATLAPADGMVWDCASGSGQAAVELAARFARVIATDASAGQIAQGAKRANIEYRVAPAEDSGLPDASVDLVTVAQALHWFDFDRFYAEVRRVLKPGGVVCAWCYGLQRVEPRIDEIIGRFYEGVVGPHWPPERRHIDSMYATVPFPFARIEAPGFEMLHEWTRERFLAYVRTWSAVKRFVAAEGRDPVDLLEGELDGVWDAGATKMVRWPLGVMAGWIHP